MPTRLVDWTFNPLVALWMAVHTCLAADGQIRLVDRHELHRVVDEHWNSLGISRLPTGEVHIDELLREDADWLSPLTLRVPFPRMYAQAGCFTVAGSFGVDHAHWLSEHLPGNSSGVIRLRANLKPELRVGLKRLGVEAQSLQSPVVDSIGRLLKACAGMHEAPRLQGFDNNAIHA